MCTPCHYQPILLPIIFEPSSGLLQMDPLLPLSCPPAIPLTFRSDVGRLTLTRPRDAKRSSVEVGDGETTGAPPGELMMPEIEEKLAEAGRSCLDGDRSHLKGFYSRLIFLILFFIHTL